MIIRTLRTSITTPNAAIAALAGVSKQTVYKQFADKERLFTEIVLGTFDQVGEPFFGGIDALEDAEDLDTAPRKLAGLLIKIVSDPRLLHTTTRHRGGRPLSRARAYLLRAGPGAHGRSAGIPIPGAGRARTPARGRCAARRAALHVAGAVDPAQSGDVQRGPDFSATELERYADEAVRIFLAAYRAS